MVSNGAEASGVFPYTMRRTLNALCMAGGEMLALLVALLAGDAVRWWLKGEPTFASWMPLLLAGWALGAWLARLLPGWGLGAVEELRRVVLVLCIVFAGTTAVLFWGKAASGASRLSLTLGFLLSVVMVPLARTRVKTLLLHAGRWGCPVAIYGDSQTAPLVVRSLREEIGIGYQPGALFLDNPEVRPDASGLNVLGGIRESTRSAPIAIVALPKLASAELADLLEGGLAGYRKVVLIPDLQDAPSLWVKPCDFVGLLGLEISVNLLDPVARFLKRSLELVATLLTAPFWVPLCGLVSGLIWLQDRHSPLFLQKRVGMRGRSFVAYKFRTMRPDAEKVLQAHLEKDAELRAEWQRDFKLRRDPRITAVGAFLRRTSLDELPQLINVLRGDMSLVGPRPLPAYHFERLPERVRKLRDRVRPGITGLWQVSGRSEAGSDGMARWDTYYVRNWSVWLDVVILVRTVRAVFSGHGAF